MATLPIQVFCLRKDSYLIFSKGFVKCKYVKESGRHQIFTSESVLCMYLHNSLPPLTFLTKISNFARKLDRKSSFLVKVIYFFINQEPNFQNYNLCMFIYCLLSICILFILTVFLNLKHFHENLWIWYAKCCKFSLQCIAKLR